MSKRGSRENLCHLLLDSGGTERLMPFERAKDGVKAGAEVAVAAGVALPKKLVARDWQLLVQPRIDLAWLAGGGVCLRLAEFPTTDRGELASMVELQLEKLSPLPPAQVVAGFEVLEELPGGVAQVLVVIAARGEVEARIEALRGRGLVVDRLDVALAREVIAQVVEEGLWIVQDPEGAPGLVAAAWRIGGRWRRVDVLRLPEGALAGATLVDALNRMAWAAELEGWLEALPVVRLVAEAGLAEVLEPALAEWTGRAVDRRLPRGVAATAADSAREALAGRGATLVPGEMKERNRQAFIDRLWIRGLGTLGVVYLIGTLGYLAWLNHKKEELSDDRVALKLLAQHYTNALRLKDQVMILEEQVNLRFAALDCWKAAAEKLPASMTLTSMNFVRGKTLRLDGLVDPSSREDVTRYNSELAAVEVRDQRLFSSVKPAQVTVRGSSAVWNFELELNRLEVK